MARPRGPIDLGDDPDGDLDGFDGVPFPSSPPPLQHDYALCSNNCPACRDRLERESMKLKFESGMTSTSQHFDDGQLS